MGQTKILIAMPVHNDFEAFKYAINGIINSTAYPHYTILIIESESTDGSKEYADLLPKLFPRVDFIIKHTKKEGPLKAYNFAFDLAKEMKCDLYLTQTDVVHFRLYKRDWMWELHEMSKNPSIGLVAPLGAWGVAYELGNPFNWIGGWACFVPYKTIELIGGYDEGYEIGDLVDVDYCYNVMQKGLKLVQADYWVQHHWMTAHVNEQRADLEQIKQRNRKRFKEKWKIGVD